MTSPPPPPELERHTAAVITFVRAMRDLVATVDAMPDPTMRWLQAVAMMGHVDHFREMVTELQNRSPRPE